MLSSCVVRTVPDRSYLKHCRIFPSFANGLSALALKVLSFVLPWRSSPDDVSQLTAEPDIPKLHESDKSLLSNLWSTQSKGSVEIKLRKVSK